MKKSEVRIGGVYMVKVSGKLARVRIEREHPLGGWIGINEKTKREVRLRSAARLRWAAEIKQVRFTSSTSRYPFLDGACSNETKLRTMYDVLRRRFESAHSYKPQRAGEMAAASLTNVFRTEKGKLSERILKGTADAQDQTVYEKAVNCIDVVRLLTEWSESGRLSEDCKKLLDAAPLGDAEAI